MANLPDSYRNFGQIWEGEIHLKYLKELLGGFLGGTIIASEDADNTCDGKERAQKIHGKTQWRGHLLKRSKAGQKIDEAQPQVIGLMELYLLGWIIPLMGAKMENFI